MAVVSAPGKHEERGRRRNATTPRASMVAFVVVLAVLAPSCTSEPVPPYGLDSIDLPEGSDEIASVLSEMPDPLEGYAATEVTTEEGGHMVRFSYGAEHQVAIAATDWGLGQGDFPPWTNEEMLPMFAETGEVAVAESALTGPLLWLTGTEASPANGDIAHADWTMWFGAPSSHWTFSVLAHSEQVGIAFVEAFVEAAS